MYAKVLMLLFFSSSISARSLDSTGKDEQNNFRESETKNSIFSDFRYVYRLYEECSAKELIPCLKMKFITAIDRLGRKVDLQIMDGIALVKDGKTVEKGDVIDNEVLEASLPRSLDEKNARLDEVLISKLTNFLASRSIQFKLDGLKDLQRSMQGEVEDGRGKKNKYGSMMLLPLMMGGSMIPMALGTLALLAGKALIIAKLALTLSLIIGLKKLLSNDDHGSYQVVSHGGGHYRRSLQDDEAAQSAAYRAYIPLVPQTSTYQYSSP